MMRDRPKILDPMRWSQVTLLVLDIAAAVVLGVVVAFVLRPH